MKTTKIVMSLAASCLFLNACINKYKFEDGNDKDPQPTESPVSKLLTGGLQDLDGKTWVLSAAPHSAGFGPYLPNTIDMGYYDFPEGLTTDDWTQGAVQNEYTFVAKNSQYIPKNQYVSAHWAYANKYFGTTQPLYANIALYDAKHKQAPFILKDEKVGITGYTLEITNGSYIGFFDARYKYEIAKINADTMVLRHKYSDDAESNPADDANVFSLTYIAKK